MPAKLYAGPYDSIPIGPNTQAPWYVIPFDDQGRCTAPLTRGQLVDAVKHGDFTDIYLFSHGWNNDWRDAVGDDPSGVATGGGYRGMFEAYGRLRRDHNLAYNRPYRPLLIGIFWPSAWLVRPSEAAPQIAADDPQLAEAAVAQERRALEELARLIDGADVEAFYAFTQQEKLSEDDARELARILLPVFNRASGAGAGAAPQIAGILDGLSPRDVIRGASVWIMKDRAGTVGAHGVADLLTDLLAASATARGHAIGHSF